MPDEEFNPFDSRPYERVQRFPVPGSTRAWKPGEHYSVTVSDPSGAAVFSGYVLLDEGDHLSIVGDKAHIVASRAILALKTP